MPNSALQYSLVTTPNPLVAGDMGTLIVLCTNQSKKRVKIDDIAIELSVGTLPKNLISETVGIQVNAPEGWKSDAQSGRFVFSPPEGSVAVGRSPVILSLGNLPITHAGGTSEITVHEVVHGEKAPNVTTFQVAKIPPELGLEFFTTTPSEVEPGGQTTLAWKGAEGATYTISYDGIIIDHVKGQTDKPLPNNGSYLIKGLDKDTDFTMVATKANVAEPVILQAHTTVVKAEIISSSVSNPNPLYGEEVTIHWTAEGETVTVDPGGHVFATPKGVTQTNSFTFTPTQKITDVTLTAKHGNQSDQRALAVSVPRPKLTQKANPKRVEPLANIDFDWELAGTAVPELSVQLVGKHSGKTYFSQAGSSGDRTQTTAGCTLQQAFGDRLSTGSVVNETLIQSCQAPWFDDDDPVSVTEEIPYNGPQNFKLSKQKRLLSKGYNLWELHPQGLMFGNIISDYNELVFAKLLNVDVKKFNKAYTWELSISGTIDNAVALSVQCVEVNGDDDWQQLWSMKRGQKQVQLGGGQTPLIAQLPGRLTVDVKLQVIATEAAIPAAMAALRLTASGPGRNVTWNASDTWIGWS